MSRRPCWIMDTSLDSMSGGVSMGCALQVTLIMAQRQTRQPLRDGKLHITNKINDRLPQWKLVNHLKSRTMTQITRMSASLGSHKLKDFESFTPECELTSQPMWLYKCESGGCVNIICITLKVSIAALYINTHSLSCHISLFIFTKQNKVHQNVFQLWELIV